MAVGFDVPEDLCRASGGVGDFVENDPFAGVGTAGFLIKGERGFPADVEGLPFEQGLLGGLLDGDEGAPVFGLLDGLVRAGPLGGSRCEAAGGQAVGDVFPEMIAAVADGGIPGGVLHGPHSVEGAGGAGQGVLGIRASGIRGGGSGRSGDGGAARLVRGTGTAAQEVARVGGASQKQAKEKVESVRFHGTRDSGPPAASMRWSRMRSW